MLFGVEACCGHKIKKESEVKSNACLVLLRGKGGGRGDLILMADDLHPGALKALRHSHY